MLFENNISLLLLLIVIFIVACVIIRLNGSLCRARSGNGITSRPDDNTIANISSNTSSEGDRHDSRIRDAISRGGIRGGYTGGEPRFLSLGDVGLDLSDRMC